LTAGCFLERARERDGAIRALEFAISLSPSLSLSLSRTHTLNRPVVQLTPEM